VPVTERAVLVYALSLASVLLLANPPALAQGSTVQINAGGPAVSPFVADKDFTGGSTISHANTINTSKVTNPAPAAVYQTGRDGNVVYTIGGFTAGSSNMVRLHFAETYWAAGGKRQFNVSINGTQVLTHFDIYVSAGGQNIANIQQFMVPANSSGQYVIQFASVIDKALVNAIEVLSSTSCTAPTTPSGLGAMAASSSHINLSWTASSSPCAGIAYTVYRSTTSGFAPSSSNQISTGVTATTYSDTGLRAATAYYYLVEAVDSGGVSGASNQATATTQSGSFGSQLIAINTGGPTVSPFVADEDFTGGGITSHANAIDTSKVTNAAPAAVYQTGRDGNFTYTIGGLTSETNYMVRLHFCETYWTAAGKREFNVSINGTQVLTHFDIYAAAGGQNIANIQQFMEPANSSGELVIQFTTIVNNALVNGIEITTSTASAPAPNIASLSPTSGAEGTLVTIAGANFGTAQGTVTFNGTAATVTSWSSPTIMVAVPSGAVSGNVVVTAGAVASNGVSFTVVPLQLPSRAQVLAAIEKVNNYWIANNAAGNSDWNQATYFSGDLAAYDATGQANYLSFAQSWASQNNYSLIGGNTTTWPDYQAAGQVYIRLYQLSNTSSDLSGITESISGMVSSTVDNEWTWIDAINMSMPDFAELGSIDNDTDYYTKMYALYSYAKYSVGLYDSKTGLWWENGTYVNTSNHWSRGNGWVFAAHAKVLSVLPQSDSHYAEYLSTFITMAQALAACQQPGGYWNPDLTGTDNAGPESSGTSFFLYGFAWGLNNGVLDRNTYLPVVEKTWNFLANTAIQPSGLLGYVQPSVLGAAPPSATSTYDYGVGAFLLAAPQVALLTQ
jgi:rhamnogalacturonyl hydrolase YesR